MYNFFSQNTFEIGAAIIIITVIIQMRKVEYEEFKYLTPNYSAINDIARIFKYVSVWLWSLTS